MKTVTERFETLASRLANIESYEPSGIANQIYFWAVAHWSHRAVIEEAVLKMNSLELIGFFIHLCRVWLEGSRKEREELVNCLDLRGELIPLLGRPLHLSPITSRQAWRLWVRTKTDAGFIESTICIFSFVDPEQADYFIEAIKNRF